MPPMPQNEIEERIIRAWRSAFPSDPRPDSALLMAFVTKMAEINAFTRGLIVEGFNREEIAEFLRKNPVP